MKLTLDPSSVTDYETFLKVKALPKYRIVGRTVEFPDEYAERLGLSKAAHGVSNYKPSRKLFDYQRDISRIAIEKRKFATFLDPGLGKTLIQGEFARHAADQLPKNKCVLMIAPPMVVPQTMAMFADFYGKDFKIKHVPARELSEWLTSGKERIGITNYEALKDETPQGRLGALVCDESSVFKSAYGKWGSICIRLGKGLDWKLCATGTPAPNDRIEYANHAVFLDHFPTVNSFLARFFVNRGQTDNRWELKPHALKPFYQALSHWSIFMVNPATYGWKDNVGVIPPIHIHQHEIPLTKEQRDLVQNETGTLSGTSPGGITGRSVLSQIAKGNHRGTPIASNKPAFIRDLIGSWPDESTLTWCLYNAEQDSMESALPNSRGIRGATPFDERMEIIEAFKAGTLRTVISKPEVLGFGLNLQIATRQVFSGLQDSYEEFYQAVKRSNRVGSTRPLNVHIPLTPIERPMVETVLAKAKRVEADAAEQERIFRESASI